MELLRSLAVFNIVFHECQWVIKPAADDPAKQKFQGCDCNSVHSIGLQIVDPRRCHLSLRPGAASHYSLCSFHA